MKNGENANGLEYSEYSIERERDTMSEREPGRDKKWMKRVKERLKARGRGAKREG